VLLLGASAGRFCSLSISQFANFESVFNVEIEAFVERNVNNQGNCALSFSVFIW
jgi:hypothetical protein